MPASSRFASICHRLDVCFTLAVTLGLGVKQREGLTRFAEMRLPSPKPEAGIAANTREPNLFRLRSQRTLPVPLTPSQVSTTLAEAICASVFHGFVFGSMDTVETAAEG